MLYASVNPEYFSAADGKFLCSIHVGGPRSGSFRGCCSYRGRDLRYLEGPLASDSSLLPFLFFFFKVSSSSLNSSKILQPFGMPQGKADVRMDVAITVNNLFNGLKFYARTKKLLHC